MTTKQQVITCHQQNPTLSAPELAILLGCRQEYVRAVAQRSSLTLPKAPPSSRGLTKQTGARIRLEREIGRAALAAGLTLEKINALAAQREAA